MAHREWQQVNITSYSGSRADQYPLKISSLNSSGTEVVVIHIFDRWQELEHNTGQQRFYFRVLLADKGQYLLRFDPSADAWEIMEEQFH